MMKQYLTLFLTIFVISGSFFGSAKAIERQIPFQPGERLTFQVRWAFIPAGEAILEVQPVKIVNGVRSNHFVMFVKTYPYVDFFYKVRDRIDSYTDVGMTHAILYKKRSKGKSKKDVVVNFDWDKRQAQYSDFGEKRDPIPILPRSFDPLSVFYALRLFELGKDVEIEVSVTDGKKSVIGKAKIIKREKIKVPSGEYDTYLVEPDLKHLGGVFKKSKNAKLQIWVTVHERHIPVRVKSKVKVGSFVAELVSVENIDHDKKPQPDVID